jgi:hypothetical protein
MTPDSPANQFPPVEPIKSPVKAVYASESVDKLAAALSKAQAAITFAAKDTANPFFKSKYADLASVWEACRAALTANELSVTQLPSADGLKVTLTTLLLHSSGQYLSSDLTMTAAANTPQAIGSAITYARRYALSAIVGVAQDDDDGNLASRK